MIKYESKIHPTAIIHTGAEIGADVEIGPYSVVGKDVQIGKGTVIASHVVIDGWTTIGTGCRIHQFASVGAPPQDIRYKGEKTEV
ncbi:MAG: acyl-[acyl-carrier-protein]--UDP-N-acetylglucosamine O-acyltransferase, partial [Deltaproteobacteria bacterium]|nr:acyl-[acyl-carrier-protein]--UDP-N-acetylglucosamine O-acyltransferase [Deltaproteobacteria bacterium]